MTANDSTYLALEIAGLRQLLAERDAEIERLKEENGALLFTYQQLETEWYAQQKLITELTATLQSLILASQL
jgi:hypothetical protein